MSYRRPLVWFYLALLRRLGRDLPDPDSSEQQHINKFSHLILLVTERRLNTPSIYWFGYTKTVPKLRHQWIDGILGFAVKYSPFIYDQQELARAALPCRCVSLVSILERQFAADRNLHLPSLHSLSHVEKNFCVGAPASLCYMEPRLRDRKDFGPECRHKFSRCQSRSTRKKSRVIPAKSDDDDRRLVERLALH